MLHFIKEGAVRQPGLNISLGKWWISFMFKFVDLGSFTATSFGFRIRLIKYPFFLPRKKQTWSIIQSYCRNKDFHLITREIWEDCVSKALEKAGMKDRVISLTEDFPELGKERSIKPIVVGLWEGD